MKILYPYNEILPTKRAHDVFIFHECAALAQLGWDTTLMVGRGSQKREALFQHYGMERTDLPFTLLTKHLIRKNNFLRMSWNLPFFLQTQAAILKHQPDWVFFSVLKQASYHLHRKIPAVRYLYEVHELTYYPNMGNSPQGDNFNREQKMLAQADLISVTTQPLKEILQRPPYSLNIPIEVVPLAVNAQPLPALQLCNRLHLMYVGQLYPGQGLETLLKALTGTQGVQLTIVGGSPSEITRLKTLTQELQIAQQVEFAGFVLPKDLPNLVQKAHAFVAPFDNSGRMPYVAHTKLHEYAEWGASYYSSSFTHSGRALYPGRASTPF